MLHKKITCYTERVWPNLSVNQCCCPRDHGLGLEWSRGPICRSWHLRSWSWSLTTGLGLGLAFKQDQDLINFYCAICWKCRDAVRWCSASSLCPGQRFNGSTVLVSTWCTLLSTLCSHGTVFVCTSDICAGWKGVQPWWPIYEATSCQTGRICVIIPPCVLEVQQALGLLECDCMDIGHCTN